MNNMTNIKSGLNPLVECPCSDRITKSRIISNPILTSGTCHPPLDLVKDCTVAIVATGAQVTSSSTVHDTNLPSGCIMNPGLRQDEVSLQGSTYSAVFNTANSSQPCGLYADNVALQGTAILFKVIWTV